MAETPIGNLVVRLDFDGQAFERGITSAKRELNSYGKAVSTSTAFAKDQNYAMKASETAMNNMRVRYQGLNAQAQNYQKIIASEVASGKRGSATWSDYSNKLADVKDKMYYASKEFDTFQRQTMIANSGFTKFGDVMTNVGTKMRTVGQGFSEAGQSIGVIAGAVTAGGALFVKQAMDFETGMISVQKTTNASAEEMLVLEENIKDMAREMPIAIGELQNLASVAGQLGIAQGDIAEFSRIMAMLGTATSLGASEAAESFARFTNITGSGMDTLENLGSALVDLGNNFATTETEIMNLAMMLVGTMSTMGASEADIMGVSAAMSALGITAERGGSSISRLFSDLGVMASEGGEELAAFAEIAGQTPDAFANMINDDAVGAFEAFIGGLSKIREEGGSVAGVLSDLGIEEIRLRDTLLRLAGGYDTLTDALATSNSAYADGSALHKEYELMASSVAAQVQKAKNELTLLAIEVGDALLPAILDLINQGDGLIDMLQSAVDWFTNLDDGVKENIVKFSALSVALAPVLMGIGSFLNLGGNLFRLVGGLNKSFGIVSGTLKALGMAGITGEVTTFTGAIAKLTTGATLLTNPLTWAAVAVAALYGGYRILTEDAREAHQAMQEFPSITDITAQQAEELRSVSDEVALINTELTTLGEGADMEGLTEAITTIGNDVGTLNDEKIKALEESFAALPKNIQASLQQAMEDTVANLEAQTARTEEVVARITEITNNQPEDGIMSPGMIREVDGLTQEVLRHYSVALSADHDQAVEIYGYMSQGYADMTDHQLRMRQQYGLEALEKEETLYENQIKALEDFYFESGQILEENNPQLLSLQDAHNSRMLALNRDAVKAEYELQVRDAEMRGELFDENHQAYEEFVNNMVNLTGMSREQIESIINSTDFNPFENLSLDALMALNDLQGLVNDFNLEVGPVDDTNIDDFVARMVDAGLTWEEIEFLSKDANVSTDVKDFLNRIAELSGGWDAFQLEYKTAEIKTLGVEELETLITLFGTDFASLTDEQVTALIEAKGLKELSDLLYAYGIWTAESPIEAKQATVETDEAIAQFIPLFEQLELWNNVEFLGKLAYVDVNSETFMEDLALVISEWSGIPLEEVKKMMLETNAPEVEGQIGEATKAHEELGNTGIAEAETSTNADETTGKINRTSATLSGLNGKLARVRIEVTDNASLQIARVAEQIRNLDGQTATSYLNSITRTGVQRMYASGTNYHSGGLAVLGDGGKREPYLTPDGAFGLSPDNDTIYDLPMGTKVWSSINKLRQDANQNSLIKSLSKHLPQYAEGTALSFLDKISIPESAYNVSSENGSRSIHVDNTPVIELLEEISDNTKRLLKKDSNTYIDRRKISEAIDAPLTSYQNKQSILNSRQKGL